jgi:anti-sigma factor RsiW
MPCPDPQLVHAYVDGELDAESAVRVEEHLAGCAACESIRQEIEAVRSTLRARTTYHRLAPGRRAAVLQKLDAEMASAPRDTTAPPRRTWRTRQYWAGTLSGALAAGLVAVAVPYFASRGDTNLVVNDVVGAHVRSLLSNRLIDVESTDRHTVKPWFAGHVDVSPPVADFVSENYRLVGGRVDYVDGRRAAVVVYRHGPHIINVFVWPDVGTRLPSRLITRNGYHVACWKNASLAFCAVSDTAVDELLGLTRLLEAMTVPDSRE